MPGPSNASGSIWDSLLRILPQSSGFMKASDALGMAPGGSASNTPLADQLAAMKAKGPPDGHGSKAWDDQIKALSRAAADEDFQNRRSGK